MCFCLFIFNTKLLEDSFYQQSNTLILQPACKLLYQQFQGTYLPSLSISTFLNLLLTLITKDYSVFSSTRDFQGWVLLSVLQIAGMLLLLSHFILDLGFHALFNNFFSLKVSLIYLI